MGFLCENGTECDGCGACLEQLESCGVCEGMLYPSDLVVKTEKGMLCNRTECLFRAAMEDLSEDDLRDYAAEFLEDFLEENKWELFEAATHKGVAFWEGGEGPLLAFAESDPACLVNFWLEKRGYERQSLADAQD